MRRAGRTLPTGPFAVLRCSKPLAMSANIVVETPRPRAAAAAVGWLALLLVLLSLLYHGTVRSMALQWWNEEDYNHGFVVPLFAAYLVWQQWDRLRALAVRADPRGLGLLALGLVLFVVGSVGAELFLQRLSIVVVLTALVVLFLGSEWLRALAFPLGFLVFAIPIPAVIRNVIAFPLQLFAAKTATLCLSSAGIPVFREGNVIVLAQTTLEVADACSGIRSLQALLALAVVFAYMSQTRSWKRLSWSSPPCPSPSGPTRFESPAPGCWPTSSGSRRRRASTTAWPATSCSALPLWVCSPCGTLLNRLAPDTAPASEPAPLAPGAEPAGSGS